VAVVAFAVQWPHPCGPVVASVAPTGRLMVVSMATSAVAATGRLRLVASAGRPLVVAAVVALRVAATGHVRVLASVVAATGHLAMLVPLAAVGPVAGEVAQATNRAGGMPPRLPLRKRGVLAVWLRPQRMLSSSDIPALAVLDGLLHRPIPGAAALDAGRPLAQLPRPFRPQQLDGAGVGTLRQACTPSSSHRRSTKSGLAPWWAWYRCCWWHASRSRSAARSAACRATW
jgi:hypothetical protein